MKIRINQPQLLSIVQATSTLYDEATVEVTREKLTIKTMDPSHIALLNIEYPRAAFVEYDIDADAKFGVRVDEVAKVLKRFDKKDVIGLGLTQDSSQLIVSSSDNKFYNLRLIEASASSSPLPKLDFKSKLEMDWEKLDKVLNDVATVSEYIRIQTQSGEATFIGQGDSGEATITADVKASGEEKATYSLDYLVKLVKAVKTDKPVKLEYSSEMPLRLSFEDGRITYYLAPRVQE